MILGFFPFCRFKHHLFDLTFIEKLTRWLTNTQVKVKGEVAESNGQAQQLMHHLNTLERRIDACEKPNLDKEVKLESNEYIARCLKHHLQIRGPVLFFKFVYYFH